MEPEDVLLALASGTSKEKALLIGGPESIITNLRKPQQKDLIQVSDRPYCRIEGCSTFSLRHGYCYKHGGAAHCKHENCKKKDRGGGYCRAHVDMHKRLCKVRCCQEDAQKFGLCALHRLPKVKRKGGISNLVEVSKRVSESVVSEKVAALDRVEKLTEEKIEPH